MRFKIIKEEFKATGITNGFNNTYNVVPKNKFKIKGTIKVTKLNISDTELAKKVILKKIDNKIKELVFLITEDEDSDGETIRQALNETTYYKSILKDKYIKFLNDLEFDRAMQKLQLIENELKLRETVYLEEINSKNMGGKAR